MSAFDSQNKRDLHTEVPRILDRAQEQLRTVALLVLAHVCAAYFAYAIDVHFGGRRLPSSDRHLFDVV